MHSVELQPISTVTADQLAVDEKRIRVGGDECWLYGAVNPATNELLQVRPRFDWSSAVFPNYLELFDRDHEQ